MTIQEFKKQLKSHAKKLNAKISVTTNYNWIHVSVDLLGVELKQFKQFAEDLAGLVCKSDPTSDYFNETTKVLNKDNGTFTSILIQRMG